ncbi:MAG: gamma-glutamyl-gamma-aminobutyrate hydrolase family protein [Acidimicrobiia bacterium]
MGVPRDPAAQEGLNTSVLVTAIHHMGELASQERMARVLVTAIHHMGELASQKRGVTSTEMSKPRIGVSVWKRPLETSLGQPEIMHALSDDYIRPIRAAGGRPVLIPPLHPEDADEVLDDLEGLIISGGGDMDPAHYGEENEGQSVNPDSDVDAWEMALVRGAQERGMPLLGVCRGMQVMNVAFGGTLSQDITDPEGVHRPVEGTPDELRDASHSVQITPGSRLAQLYGVEQRLVNTIHHQAPAKVPESLTVVARAPDGAIEALEYNGEWYALGVQWHPERWAFEEEGPLFKSLIGEAGRYRRDK